MTTNRNITSNFFINASENEPTRQRVKRYMNHYGTTNKHFAKSAGVNVSNFSSWINGSCDFGGKSIEKINHYINKMTVGVDI